VITGPVLGSQHDVAVREDAPRVLVVGGGFGGLAAVAKLARTGYRVTLADRHIYATFQPLLYQVATAGLAPSDVAYPLRGFAHRQQARFRHGDLSGIDPAARIAEFSDGGRVGYDYLILATGVAAAFFGITGAAEHSYGLYTLHDAVSLRERIMAGLERLSIAAHREEVTVSIVGGGATGVELAGTLADLRNLALPASYPDLDPACVHIRLVEMAPGVLGPFAPPLREYAAQQLRARGVDLRLNATIKEITAESIILDSGEVLPSDLTAWAAGISGPDEARQWGLPQGRGGRLLTGPDLRVAGKDRIFAIGDIALIDGHPLPQLAQPALQMGRHAAAQIRRLEAGQPTVPFSYHDKGIMATIGSRSAVVQLNHGIRFRGVVAWFAWLALHLVTLLGGRNRINALINLSWRYLSWQRGGGIIVGDDPPAPGTTGLGTASPMSHQRPLAGRSSPGQQSPDQETPGQEPADGQPAGRERADGPVPGAG
jgi:NADH dehydrogenase